MELTSTNALWGQSGWAWRQLFLDVLARDFGTGLRAVDYHATETARSQINAWVSEQTRTRIRELIPSGAVDSSTRLTLTNALYLKAPWQNPFDLNETGPEPFHRLDGSTVSATMMHSSGDTQLTRGPGWVAIDLPYGRGELAMAVVVPDEGAFATVLSTSRRR